MQQGDAAWLEERARHAITWSQAAAALGIGYISRRAYMREKLGLSSPPVANWRMLEGQRREPWVAELYFRLMGSCGSPVVLATSPFQQDPADKRLGGSPDRIVHCGASSWLLEIKTQPGADNQRLHIPVGHLLQMHGLCHTYGLPFAHYACWCAARGLFVAEVHFDPALWDYVYPRYRQFADWWTLRQLPPPMPSSEKCELECQITRMCSVVSITAVHNRLLLLGSPETTANFGLLSLAPRGEDSEEGSPLAASEESQPATEEQAHMLPSP